MYATLRIRGRAADAALTVPRSRCSRRGSATLVFVKRAGRRLEPREVALGATSERPDRDPPRARGRQTRSSRPRTFLVDAESNLGTALGGMGDMPGMDMRAAALDAARPPRPSDHQPGEGAAAMLKRIIAWSVANQLLVVLVHHRPAIAGGICAPQDARSRRCPTCRDVQVIVQADYNEQAPRIVEDQVTYPIAAEMLKVPGARDGARLLVLRRVVRLRHLRRRHRPVLGALAACSST